MSKGKITLQEIAKEANVSLTTASLYLNGKAQKYRVSKVTCERIEKVIKKHNYSPNIHARAMASKKTYLIGVILRGDIGSSFWLDIVNGIEEHITKKQYHMLLSVSNYTADTELEAFEFMKSKGADGFIFAPVMDDDGSVNADYVRKLGKQRPVVSITYPVKGIPGVYTDGTEGGRIAAKKLYETGHRKIAYLGVCRRQYDLRGTAFSAAMKDYGIKVAEYMDIDDLLDNGEQFTGVFCFSDFLAMAIYREAAKRGISIPGDLSVIGYDNMFFSDFLVPRLTTIHQNKKELGTFAANKLMRLLCGENASEVGSTIFLPKIVERESVLKQKK